MLLVLASSAAAFGPLPVQIGSKSWTIGRGDTLTLWAPIDKIKADNHDPAKLYLLLNGVALKSLHPSEISSASNEVKFVVKVMTEDRAAWTQLLGRPDFNFTKGWKVSIGYEDLGEISTRENIAFMAIRPWAFWAFVVAIILAGWRFIHLARTTTMLKDPGGLYSLGRFQMAIWFFLVIAAFVFVWGITADRNIEIPASVLGLIGISAGTGLAAQVIDNNKSSATKKDDEASLQEMAGLKARIDELDRNLIPNAADGAAKALLAQEKAEKTQRLATVEAQMAATASNALKKPEPSFWDDILSDENGISFHRFQIFAWTIVLAVVFIHAVYNELQLPDFNQTLLGLMGISSGTYIGFKVPEK
jgi:hypothetical protein